ncbi:MAG TPA: hypothetical protein VFL90_00825, partial [Methylomirabilota bacterium]|nr:hypothetical protein [Methylomirabilota bacterium]
APATPPDASAVAQDLVALPPPLDVAVALGELATPLAAHRQALARGDLAAVRAVLASDAAAEASAEYARLTPPFEHVEVVGVARIGRQRVVKLALAGAQGRQVLQERWVPSADGWRVVVALVQ